MRAHGSVRRRKSETLLSSASVLACKASVNGPQPRLGACSRTCLLAACLNIRGCGDTRRVVTIADMSSARNARITYRTLVLSSAETWIRNASVVPFRRHAQQRKEMPVPRAQRHVSRHDRVGAHIAFVGVASFAIFERALQPCASHISACVWSTHQHALLVQSCSREERPVVPTGQRPGYCSRMRGQCCARISVAYCAECTHVDLLLAF